MKFIMNTQKTSGPPASLKPLDTTPSAGGRYRRTSTGELIPAPDTPEPVTKPTPVRIEPTVAPTQE